MIKKQEICILMKMQNFEKNSKLNCGKSVYLRPMKFLIQIHVEVKSIHVKSYDSETHSMADMAKKTFFAFLGIFLAFLGQKNLINI